MRQFDLTVPSLDLATLPGVMVGDNALVQAILQRIENGDTGTQWPALHGTIRAGNATLGTLTMNDAVATLDIAGAVIKIDSFDAHALDGTLHMSGSIHAGSKPVYTIEAQLNQASVPAIGLLFHQNWGSGTVNVATHLKMSGLSQADLLSSAQGMYHFDWSKGGLHSVAKTSTQSPFSHFEQWTADGAIGNSTLTLDQSLLTDSDGARSIQGAIGFDRKLDLKTAGASAVAPAGEAGELTGTMSEPVFTPSAAVQP